MLQVHRANSLFAIETLFFFLGKRKTFQWHQRETILRANVHAAAAQDAFRAFRFIPFEYGVDPALQAAAGFGSRLLFGVSGFDLRHTRAPLDRECRYCQTWIFVVAL